MRGKGGADRVGIASRRSSGHNRTMGDVVNLNKLRKAKARVEAKVQAEANRVKFGRTKAERKRDEIERDRLVKAVEGVKLDGD
ncbi:DUF4169 family protein [Rhizorhabdus sp.]|uniref:DUF4169 family protein n=1 Tax=Rhizorhabdus sp. TaxID=1968843 RepID=UPI00344B2649